MAVMAYFPVRKGYSHASVDPPGEEIGGTVCCAVYRVSSCWDRFGNEYTRSETREGKTCS